MALLRFNGLWDSYVELGVTLAGFVKVSLLDLAGVEAARGSTEEGLAGESPAASQSSD
jgi:hypothetical protein